MKRKISMLLSIILVATSLIACEEETQTVESPSPTQTQPSEPTTPDEMQPVDIEDNSDDEIVVPVAVILEGEHYIEDTDNVNRFLSIIENATFTEEMPVSPAGSFLFEFYVVSSDDSIREFEMNSGYLFEYVDGECIFYILDDIEDFNFVVSFIDTQEEDTTDQITQSTPPSEPVIERLTDEHDVYAVTLGDTVFIDDLEGINKILDIIDNTTIYEEMPISTGGGRTFNVGVVLVDSFRDFEVNSTYMTESFGSKKIYRVFNNPDDFIYLVNLLDGEN